MVKLKTLVKRGNLVESIHNIKCLIKDSNYQSVFSTNNDEDLVYPRSAVKIFQAVPFVLSGAIEKYNLNNKILAMSCSSHCGQNEHLKVLNIWQKKISVLTKELKCGSHNPINTKASEKLLLSGNLPNQLHNNCAGKHLAMLSGIIANNMSKKNYISYNHEYQKLIRDSLEYFTGIKIKKNSIAVDGCSAPQYAFPIDNLASSMIKIFDKNQPNKKYLQATKRLFSAIKLNPSLIAGIGRFDSEIIKITKGRIFCKGGAEGVLLFSDNLNNIGGIIKVEDGSERAVAPIAIKIFYRLGLIKMNEKKFFDKWINHKIYNHAKTQIGEIFGNIKN